MNNQGRIVLGIIVILFGGLLLVGSLLKVDLWALACPGGLVLLGLWLLLRPWLAGPETGFHVLLLGDLHRRGQWQVGEEEIYVGVGGITLDLSQAEVPLGEGKVRIMGFVGDVKVIVPEGVGLALSTRSVVADLSLLGRKKDYVFAPVGWSTEGYEFAERRLHLDMMCFVASVKVKRPNA